MPSESKPESAVSRPASSGTGPTRKSDEMSDKLLLAPEARYHQSAWGNAPVLQFVLPTSAASAIQLQRAFSASITLCKTLGRSPGLTESALLALLQRGAGF